MGPSKDDIIDKALANFGFPELNPVQKLAIQKGLLENNNIVISAPTASGKTLCAALLGLDNFFNHKKKMLYICPLVALAQEHYNTFKEKFSKLGIKVALSVGDLDSSDPWLRDYDWIICSNEKADSLIRHGADWINDVGVVVADEIHMLTDHSRGPTLEILLTRLRKMIPHAKFLGLSATINNAKELGNWLNASVVVSEWRPVKLYEGVSFDSTMQFFNWKKYELNENLQHELAIFENTLGLKKQVLFFVSTRKNAEALAERLCKIINNNPTQRERLKEISEKVLNVLEVPTKQCKRLAKCISIGVAFHHAGLLGKQRSTIEDEFRKGTIKAIVATPTLAMGVNLPAFRVVVRDAKRYYSGYGTRFIPVLEYKQFSGRCGRPQFDEWGESILLAKSEDEAHELTERYILSDPEDIASKLALEPVLRMHTLALIASGFINTEKSLVNFFEQTFYAFQYEDISEIQTKLERIIDMLIKFKFLVRDGERTFPTRLGKRVSELYIDPLTGHHFVKCLDRATKVKPTHFTYLHMITDTIEMKPLFQVRERDVNDVQMLLVKNENHFLEEIPDEWSDNYDEFMKSIKTTMVFHDWVSEATEDELLRKYNITPGELRTRLTNADWLLYSTHEIATLLNYKNLLTDLKKLRVRLKYGVKEELIPLVRLEGIGRIRARKLYSRNLKTIESLRKIPVESLGRIVGPQIAASIKKQLGEKPEEIKEVKQITLNRTG